MISKDTEYSMLKQEIISTTDIISNITLAMYTITVSIIVLAIETENAVIFWLLILFCIPFRILSTEKETVSIELQHTLRFFWKRKRMGGTV